MYRIDMTDRSHELIKKDTVVILEKMKDLVEALKLPVKLDDKKDTKFFDDLFKAIADVIGRKRCGYYDDR